MKSRQECQHSLESYCWTTLDEDFSPINPYSECPLGGWKQLDHIVLVIWALEWLLFCWLAAFAEGTGQICYLNHHTPFAHSRTGELSESAGCALSSLSPVYSCHMYHTSCHCVTGAWLAHRQGHADRLTIVDVHHVNIWSMKSLKKSMWFCPLELFNFPAAQKWFIQSFRNQRMFKKNVLYLVWLLHTYMFSKAYPHRLDLKCRW